MDFYRYLYFSIKIGMNLTDLNPIFHWDIVLTCFQHIMLRVPRIVTILKLFIYFTRKLLQKANYYEWVKRTKFLLAVIYGSLRRHSDSSKTFKKIVKKCKYSLMTIFRLAESFKTMNRPARLWPSLTAHFSESIKDKDVKFYHNLYLSLWFVLLKFRINIFDSLENMDFLAT